MSRFTTTTHVHQPEPDPGLRARFHEGSPDAAAALAVAFFDDAFRFCRSMVGGEEEAHEAVQETFLRLIERHRMYDPAQAFRPWLFGICRNTCLHLLRYQRTRQARVVDLDPTEDEVAALAARVPGALEALLRDEREREVMAALEALAEAKRTIVVLHLFEELTFREIGAMLGRSPNTVATTYYRTLNELRGLVEAGATMPPAAGPAAHREEGTGHAC